MNEYTMQIQAHVDFNNLDVVCQEGVLLIIDKPVVHFDFSKVQKPKSNILLLLTAWVRAAKKHKKDIAFYGISEKLLSLSRAYGLESILPLTSLSKGL